MAGRRTRFWSGILSFTLALACTTRQFSTSYKGRSGRQNLMPTWRPLAQPSMPQIKTYTACSSSPQLVQRSPWFGGFRAKYRLREQDTDNRRGQPFARMTSTRMRPGQDPDDYLYHTGSCRDSLNACDPPNLRPHGSAVRGHYYSSPFLGVRPYSSNPS